MIDVINTSFIVGSSLYLLRNIFILYKDKQVRGVSVSSQVFFMIWTYWSLYYYWSLSQPVSMIAELALSILCMVYVGLMVYYKRKESQEKIWYNDR